jgi:hypothetical protein
MERQRDTESWLICNGSIITKASGDRTYRKVMVSKVLDRNRSMRAISATGLRKDKADIKRTDNTITREIS